MNHEDYAKRYHDLVASVGETRVIALAAGPSLEEFPEHLRGGVKEAAVEALGQLARTLEEVTADGPPDDTVTIDLPGVEGPSDEGLKRLIVNSFVARIFAEEEPGMFEVTNALHAQELVMILAHLEAFLADTIRAICMADPRVLRRGKKVSWEEVVSCGGWDELMTFLSEEYAFETGWKSIPERIEHLRDQHGLEIDVPEGPMAQLAAAEQLRHLILHNGGRVSPEFLRRTGADYEVGEKIVIDGAFGGSVAFAALALANAVFDTVSEKFFETSLDEVGGVRIDFAGDTSSADGGG